MLLVDAAHQRGGRRQDLVDEDEDGLLRGELDALADDVDELAHGEVGRDEVLLLVDGGDVGLFDLLADHLEGVCVSMEGRCQGGEGGEGGGWNVKRRTGMRSAYFWRMRSASALLFSNGLSPC